MNDIFRGKQHAKGRRQRRRKRTVMHLDKVEDEEPILDRDIIEQNLQSFEHDEDDDRERVRENEVQRTH